MASFTEQAILKVVDKASAQIRKINAELRKLAATARSIKNIKVAFNVDTSKLQAASKLLNTLAHNRNQLGRGAVKLNVDTSKLTAASKLLNTLAHNRGQLGRHPINLQVNTAGINHAQAAINRLRSSAARPINVNVHGGGGAGGPGGPGGRPPGGYWGNRTMLQAGGAGFASGMGMGFGRLVGSFGAVEAAGYAAAKALQAVASKGYERERAQLAEAGVSSPEQLAVFRALDEANKGKPKGALDFSENQFNLLRSSLQGDVGNTDAINKAIDAARAANKPEEVARLMKAAAVERAQRADALARYFQTDIAPGIYARNPKLTQEEAVEGLRKIAQAVGIATGEMYRGLTEEGLPNLSDDAKRVFEGVRLAQIADPNLDLNQIKTAIANVKSMGYTMTSRALADMLINIGTKGIRAANETYTAGMTGMGVVDVKKLNNMLVEEGLTESFRRLPGKPAKPAKAATKGRGGRPGKPARPGRPAVPGNVETGSIVPVRAEQLLTDPQEWWRQSYRERFQGKIIQEERKRAETAARARGESAAQAAAAAAAAEQAIIEGNIPAARAAMALHLRKRLSGAKQSAITGILDAIFGEDIMRSALDQAEGAPKPGEINKQAGASWATQADNLWTKIGDAFAGVGDKIAESIGLSEGLKNLGNLIANNPGWTVGIAALGAPLAAVVGTAILSGITAPFTSLTTAGTQLQASAGQLSAAARALMGGNVPGGGVPDVPGPDGKKPGGKPIGKWGRAGRWLLGGAAIASVAIPFFDVLVDMAERSEEESRTAEERAQRVKEKTMLEGVRAQIERDRKVQEDSGVPPSPAMAAQAAKDADRLQKINARLAILESEFKPPTPVKTEPIVPDKPVPITTTFTKDDTKPVRTLDVTPTTPTTKDFVRIAREAQERAGQVPVVPAPAVPAAAPTTTAAATKAAAAAKPSAVDALAALIPQLAQTANSITLATTGLNTSSTAITAGISGLTAAGTTFSTVFSAGATSIGTAGQTAASTLQGAAPSIGAAIGAAAAAAISAATANISVNVNNNTSPAPTSSSKAQN